MYGLLLSHLRRRHDKSHPATSGPVSNAIAMKNLNESANSSTRPMSRSSTGPKRSSRSSPRFVLADLQGMLAESRVRAIVAGGFGGTGFVRKSSRLPVAGRWSIDRLPAPSSERVGSGRHAASTNRTPSSRRRGRSRHSPRAPRRRQRRSDYRGYRVKYPDASARWPSLESETPAVACSPGVACSNRRSERSNPGDTSRRRRREA